MAKATDLSFRPIGDADTEFLRRVYASTRAEEMELVDWPEAEKEKFLDFQFDAQHRYYQEQFPAGRFDLIVWRGEPVGRFYLDSREDELRLIDIALLPEYRGRGLGGGILRDLLARATEERKAVRIHVEQNNPALRLYQRLGFRELEEQGVYLLMEWRPPPADGQEKTAS